MPEAVSPPTTLSPAVSLCSPLDHLEAEQRAVSDVVLELERHRFSLLLQPGTDAEIARIDRHIARHSHRLDQLGEIEQALLTTSDEQDHPMTRTIQGEAAFRARCTAITESNEGKMNMALASHLALKTSLSADVAIETMRIAAGNVGRSEFRHLNDNPAAGVAIATAIARGTAR